MTRLELISVEDSFESQYEEFNIIFRKLVASMIDHVVHGVANRLLKSEVEIEVNAKRGAGKMEVFLTRDRFFAFNNSDIRSRVPTVVITIPSSMPCTAEEVFNTTKKLNRNTTVDRNLEAKKLANSAKMKTTDWVSAISRGISTGLSVDP